jgi:hypothetical protein
MQTGGGGRSDAWGGDLKSKQSHIVLALAVHPKNTYQMIRLTFSFARGHAFRHENVGNHLYLSKR